MRKIHLTARQARLLRDNLVSQESGYDYVDLIRLDHLAKRLTSLQGEYATSMADAACTERQIRRRLARADTPAETDAANRELMLLSYDVADLHEAADKVQVTLEVEDGDHKLIAEKLDAVGRWQGNDDLRAVIIGMLEAVKSAEGDAELPEPKQLRRR